MKNVLCVTFLFTMSSICCLAPEEPDYGTIFDNVVKGIDAYREEPQTVNGLRRAFSSLYDFQKSWGMNGDELVDIVAEDP